MKNGNGKTKLLEACYPFHELAGMSVASGYEIGSCKFNGTQHLNTNLLSGWSEVDNSALRQVLIETSSETHQHQIRTSSCQHESSCV